MSPTGWYVFWPVVCYSACGVEASSHRPSCLVGGSRRDCLHPELPSIRQLLGLFGPLDGTYVIHQTGGYWLLNSRTWLQRPS
jgi:hypothetical protein